MNRLGNLVTLLNEASRGTRSQFVNKNFCWHPGSPQVESNVTRLLSFEAMIGLSSTVRLPEIPQFLGLEVQGTSLPHGFFSSLFRDISFNFHMTAITWQQQPFLPAGYSESHKADVEGLNGVKRVA